MLWCVLPNVVMARGYFEGVAHRNDKGWSVTTEHIVHAGGDKGQHDPLSTDYGFVDCAPADPRLVNVTGEQVVGEKFVLRWGSLQNGCVDDIEIASIQVCARVFYHGTYNRRLCSTWLSPTATSADLRMGGPWNDFFGVYAELELNIIPTNRVYGGSTFQQKLTVPVRR